MNEMKIFNNEDFGKVRTVLKDGEVWFVGKDIADILGYSETNDMTRWLDKDEKETLKDFDHEEMEVSNKVRMITLINESGLYNAVFNSKKPEAKKFKKWVTSEVLPAIRKHGGYLTPQKIEDILSNPDTIIKLATDLKAEREKRIEAELKIELDKPKVIFAEAVESFIDSILIREMAKLLSKNGINIGEKKFYQWLRDNKYVQLTCNEPTQRAVNLGVLELKEGLRFGKNKVLVPCFTTKVTGKGQIYFMNKLKKELM